VSVSHFALLASRKSYFVYSNTSKHTRSSETSIYTLTYPLKYLHFISGHFDHSFTFGECVSHFALLASRRSHFVYSDTSKYTRSLETSIYTLTYPLKYLHFRSGYSDHSFTFGECMSHFALLASRRSHFIYSNTPKHTRSSGTSIYTLTYPLKYLHFRSGYSDHSFTFGECMSHFALLASRRSHFIYSNTSKHTRSSETSTYNLTYYLKYLHFRSGYSDHSFAFGECMSHFALLASRKSHFVYRNSSKYIRSSGTRIYTLSYPLKYLHFISGYSDHSFAFGECMSHFALLASRRSHFVYRNSPKYTRSSETSRYILAYSQIKLHLRSRKSDHSSL